MLYGETTPEESYMLHEIIEQNDTLKGEFHKMRSSKRALYTNTRRPSRSVVNNILNYSKDNSLEFSS